MLEGIPYVSKVPVRSLNRCIMVFTMRLGLLLMLHSINLVAQKNVGVTIKPIHADDALVPAGKLMGLGVANFTSFVIEFKNLESLVFANVFRTLLMVGLLSNT